MEKETRNGAQTPLQDCKFCNLVMNIGEILDNGDSTVLRGNELTQFIEVDLYSGMRDSGGHNIIQTRYGSFPVNFCPVCGDGFLRRRTE